MNEFDLKIRYPHQTGRNDADHLGAFDIETILKKAKSNGKRAGIYTLTPEFAKRMINLGFDYVVISSDARMLTLQAKKILEDLRKEN